LQPHAQNPAATTSIAMHDSVLHLQASSLHLSHARHLQGIPYPVGAANSTSVPHGQSRCSNSVPLYGLVYDCASTSRKVAQQDGCLRREVTSSSASEHLCIMQVKGRSVCCFQHACMKHVAIDDW
jgi:hypothetical protein